MRRANEDSQESACHTIRDAFRCFIHGPARLNTDIGTIMATYVQNARNILNDDTPDFMGGRPSSVPVILPLFAAGVDILPCVCKGKKAAALLKRSSETPVRTKAPREHTAHSDSMPSKLTKAHYIPTVRIAQI